MCLILLAIQQLLIIHVLAEDSIHAPATQQVLAGEDIMLQCSSGLPGTEITWRDPSDRTLNSATLEQVNLGHQGRYACRILDTFGASTVYTVIINWRS